MEEKLKLDKSVFVCYKTNKINDEYLLGETLGQVLLELFVKQFTN